MKKFSILMFLFAAVSGFSQSTISGKVTNRKGDALAGANVFLEGTYDGTVTAEDGTFSFETSETGQQILVVSLMHYETWRSAIIVETYVGETIALEEGANALDAVIVTAGTFEAGERARVAVLKPLDIVTTAGSAGDIVAALQTLPGTQTVGEDGRLFVRGGEADETQTFVDGLRVAQPYGPSAANLPVRGRFSPFLFSGIAFSTGGYSAEYGEALSSVLLLQTQDEPPQSQTDIALMTVGLGLGHTQKRDKSSISFNAAYTDLAPYQVAVPQDVDWNRPYQSLAGEAVYRYQFTNGLFKTYAAFDASRFSLNQPDFSGSKTRVSTENDNFYLNSSYDGSIGNAWTLFGGISLGYSNNDISLNRDRIDNSEYASHLKLKLTKKFSNTAKLSFGSDYFYTDFSERFREDDGLATSGYESNLIAVFTEGDIRFSKSFAVKAGVRAAHNSLLAETSLSPRLSLAYKISKNSQFSFAYGDFLQAPRQQYLKHAGTDQFKNERATHYIMNYQYSREKQTFRAEAYYKNYDRLVTFTGSGSLASDFSNAGEGYATGLDLFWRDNKSIENLEYWISYSYIDTERLYQNFPQKATPGFVADQSLSVVTKYWINKLRSQLGVTGSFASGRPYHDPNQSQFINSQTKGYSNISLSWAYLLGPQKILYFSMSNVLGTQNVFGYEYANAPDTAGVFQRRAIVPQADRFFFIGFFWTISDDKKTNQLKNL